MIVNVFPPKKQNEKEQEETSKIKLEYNDSYREIEENGIIKINIMDILNLPGVFVGDVIKFSSYSATGYATLKVSINGSVPRGYVGISRQLKKDFDILKGTYLDISAVTKVPSLTFVELALEYDEDLKREHLWSQIIPYFRKAKRVINSNGHFEVITRKDYTKFRIFKIEERERKEVQFGRVEDTTWIKCGKWEGNEKSGLYNSEENDKKLPEELESSMRLHNLEMSAIDRSRYFNNEKYEDSISNKYYTNNFKNHNQSNSSPFYDNYLEESDLYMNTNNNLDDKSNFYKNTKEKKHDDFNKDNNKNKKDYYNFKNDKYENDYNNNNYQGLEYFSHGYSKEKKSNENFLKVNNNREGNHLNLSNISNSSNRSHLSKKKVGGVEFWDIEPDSTDVDESKGPILHFDSGAKSKGKLLVDSELIIPQKGKTPDHSKILKNNKWNNNNSAYPELQKNKDQNQKEFLKDKKSNENFKLNISNFSKVKNIY